MYDIQKLLEEGKEVLGSRISSRTPFIYDQVDNIKYQKWVMNCIGFLGDEVPEHVRQIKAIYKPQDHFINIAEQIFGILSSAAEYLKHKQFLQEILQVKISDIGNPFLPPEKIPTFSKEVSGGIAHLIIVNNGNLTISQTAGITSTALSQGNISINTSEKNKIDNSITKTIHKEYKKVVLDHTPKIVNVFVVLGAIATIIMLLIMLWRGQ